VAARFSGWYLKNKAEINSFIAEHNLPELNQFKAFDKWLFFFTIDELKKQLPEAEDQDILVADTEYFLRSMCPISLTYKDGELTISRQEYKD
jgi:hypothetical protein